MRTLALVRELPHSFAALSLRSDATKAINQNRALEQHSSYTRLLKNILGERNVIEVEPMHDMPDSCFVEDAVVVLRNKPHAIGMRMGAESRVDEAMSVWNTLSKVGVTVSKSSHETSLRKALTKPQQP